MKRRLHLLGFYFRSTLYMLPFVSFAIAWILRFDVAKDIRPGPHSDTPYLVLSVVFIGAWIVALEHYKVCDPQTLFLQSMGIRRLCAVCIMAYASTASGLFFYRGVTFSRLFLPTSAIVLLVLSSITRAVFVRLAAVRCRGSNSVRVLIVGADAFARRAGLRLMRVARWCRVIGYVRLAGQEVALLNGPVYEWDSLDGSEICAGVDEVAIAIPPARFGQLHQIMAAVEKLSLPTRVILDVGTDVFSRERLFRLGGLNLLDLGHGPADAVDYVVAKRVFDIVFSVIVLTTLAPFMLLIGLAVRLTSPGPIIFRQERVGLNGRKFQMFKFRTMDTTKEAEDDMQWTTQNDSRRTCIGRWLRRSSLDELPQFVNVLKGEMSVVGPRPERPFFVKKFMQEVYRYQTRHQLKVGITGWAQVNGLRGDTSIEKRVEYDLYYMRNWSIWFDLRIIARTVVSGLFSSNAY